MSFCRAKNMTTANNSFIYELCSPSSELNVLLIVLLFFYCDHHSLNKYHYQRSDVLFRKLEEHKNVFLDLQELLATGSVFLAEVSNTLHCSTIVFISA